MAINLISIRCPDCGAALDVEENRKLLYCSYCGTKILINNDNEYILRHVDEAEIKKAESNEAIKLKKLEIIDNQREEETKLKKTKIKISIILGIICLAALSTGNETIGTVGFVAGGILFFMWQKNIQ